MVSKRAGETIRTVTVHTDESRYPELRGYYSDSCILAPVASMEIDKIKKMGSVWIPSRLHPHYKLISRSSSDNHTVFYVNEKK